MFHMTSQVGRLLHTDHLATLDALQKLESFLVKNGAKKPPAMDDASVRAMLELIKGIVTREVGCHFGFEEEHLFPALAEAGQVGMTMLLKSEHAAILPVAQEIGGLTETALSGNAFAAGDWQRFHELGMELLEREMFHIQKEEMGLLAAINALIDDETDAKLARIFEGMKE